VIADLAAMVAECVKNPGKQSVWSADLGKYVCLEGTQEATPALEVSAPKVRRRGAENPPLSPQFKLVFLTAAGGTFLFVLICLGMTLVAGKNPPPLFEKVIMGFFDLAKIGFGAAVGLLGGQKLQAEAK
jgi:hypothetical protein